MYTYVCVGMYVCEYEGSLSKEGYGVFFVRMRSHGSRRSEEGI